MKVKLCLVFAAGVSFHAIANGAVITSGSGSVGVEIPTTNFVAISSQAFAIGQWQSGVEAGAELSIYGTMTMSESAHPTIWNDNLCFGVSRSSTTFPVNPVNNSNWGVLMRVQTAPTTNVVYKLIEDSAEVEAVNAPIASANRQINYAMNLKLSDEFNSSTPITNEYTLGIDWDNNGVYDATRTGTFILTGTTDRLRFGMGVVQAGSGLGRTTLEALTNNYTYVVRDHFIPITNSTPAAGSQLIAGWTRNITWPSEKNPDLNELKVRVDSTGGFKYDRGSSDLTYGSGFYANVADEMSYHSSTTCYTIATNTSIKVSITNDLASGNEIQLDALMADWTAPWATSAKTINMRYIEGDLGIASNTLIASQDGTTSGITNFADFSDVDASLLSYDAADRTLLSGEYAVFEITAARGGNGAIYIDNIGLGASLNLGLSGFDLWVLSYGLTGTNALATANPDGDRYNNLYEYGLGGDPSDSASTGHLQGMFMEESGGTNYFVYIHPRRTTLDHGLTYTLEQDNDLSVNPPFSFTGDYTVGGTSSINADFEAVTNYIPTTGKTKEFIKLLIEE